MLEVLEQDYVRTARAKGLAWWGVVVRHALKNALIPIVTIFGLQFGNLLAGAVIVETVFSRPGLGRLIVGGILAKDFPLVQGSVLFVATAYVLINVLVDVAYAFVDPQIQGRVIGRQRGAVIGLVILGGLALIALGAPWLSARDPIRTAPRDALQAPGSRFVLGSDQLGRDVRAAWCMGRGSPHRRAHLRLDRVGPRGTARPGVRVALRRATRRPRDAESMDVLLAWASSSRWRS